MILNAFAVLDASLALLRLPLGFLLIGLGLAAWARSRRPAPPEARQALEDRNYLLSSVALLLLGLNVAAWPLLYLLLQSYVPEWPGVMCIYGVTQVGAGSAGSARFLPGLLTALQLLKPLLVFASGAWLVLYLLNRQTQTGPLLGRLLLALVVCGALTVADAGAELAYLVIPKKEEPISTGCCVGVFEEGAALDVVREPGNESWLEAAYYATNLALLAALLAGVRSARPVSRLTLAVLLAGAGAMLVAGGAFLVEVVAPAVLRLPYHHCPYDLVGGAPDVLVGAALAAWGAFAVGWACVAGWFGRHPEMEPVRGEAIGWLLFMAFCASLGSVVLLSVELALA